MSDARAQIGAQRRTRARRVLLWAVSSVVTVLLLAIMHRVETLDRALWLGQGWYPVLVWLTLWRTRG